MKERILSVVRKRLWMQNDFRENRRIQVAADGWSQWRGG